MALQKRHPRWVFDEAPWTLVVVFSGRAGGDHQ
jgi:hypothetical protein